MNSLFKSGITHEHKSKAYKVVYNQVPALNNAVKPNEPTKPSVLRKAVKPDFGGILLKQVQKEFMKSQMRNDLRSLYFQKKGNPFYLQPGSAIRVTHLHSKSESQPVTFSGIMLKSTSKTVLVRSLYAGVYVEKNFQLQSPLLLSVEVLHRSTNIRENAFDVRENPEEYFKVMKSKLVPEKPEAYLKKYLAKVASNEEIAEWKSFKVSDYLKKITNDLEKAEYPLEMEQQ